MSLRFFCARTECGEVGKGLMGLMGVLGLMGLMGLLGLLGLMGAEESWFEPHLRFRRGRETRAERGSALLTPHAAFCTLHSQFPIPNSQFPIPNSQFPIPTPLPLCVPCVSVFTPLRLPNKKIAQANRAAVVDLRDLKGVSSRLPDRESTPLS